MPITSRCAIQGRESSAVLALANRPGSIPAGATGFYDEFLLRMNEFMGVTRQADVLRECVSTSREVMSGEYYKALTRCRRLLTYEQELLADVSSSLPDSGNED